jgi:Na+/H+-translocating membrane pyrophosphatase
MSNTVPILALAVCSYVCMKVLGMLGVALGALGMLSNLACSLAIDAYGPISDNAGGIAEMAELGDYVRERTDALDAAGNTTAAIGKGFVIGSAALVSLSLYGAFVTRARKAAVSDHVLGSIEVLDPLVFTFLLIGAMLPYWFSALTMKSVGKAVLEMVKEVRR